MHHRAYFSVAAVTAAAFVISGCSGGANSDASATTDTVNMSLTTDPSSFDPTLARGADDYTVAPLLFDTLLRKDDGGALVGGLASKWEAIDASNYSLQIRGDAKCSDGTPITPTVVAASLGRFASPETGSSGRSLAFGAAKPTFAADDASGTVKVTLSAGWSDFLTGLALPQSAIVCPAGLADLKGLSAGTVQGAFSGPYTLKSAQPAVKYEFALRDDYSAWPAFSKPLEGTPAKNLVFTPISEYSTIATQLLAGSLDIGGVADENVARFKDNDGFTQQSAANNTTYILFNERPGTAFADKPDLRKAVAQTIDPKAFSDIISDSRGKPILSVGSENIKCVNTDTSLITPLDPAAAAKVLAGVKIRIVGTTFLTEGNEYVAEALRKAGADVDVKSLDNGAWSALTGKGGTDWDINVQGDNNLMGTLPSSLLRVMGPPAESGGRNKTGAVNDEGYAALTAGMNAVDADEQCAAFKKAQASFLKRVDAVPLATLPFVTVAAKGFSIRQFGEYMDPATIRINK
ncbi:ABC transporter substrate-binding protein [Paenarthrobacter sp. NPDC089322]|uniref:ABC transporter substrate-binding protein n=1 Tax=Paenarthrobacter sp. NPDC089322 TaxID=3155065 RepID=UPI00341FCC21